MPKKAEEMKMRCIRYIITKIRHYRYWRYLMYGKRKDRERGVSRK